MKFYLDEDLSPRVVAALREKGIDAESAHEAGNLQISDREQLAYAAERKRCLVTRNARHYVLLASEAINQGRPHSGILLCSPRLTGADVRAIVDRLIRVAREHPRGLGQYDIFYL